MNILPDSYYKSLAKNDEQLQLWQNYLLSLQALDFSVYSDKLKVPALIPIGNKILFRGELKHTNEVTFALGADYFAKCSASQAEVIRQHRIKGAESKIEAFLKERAHIQNQLKNVFISKGHEIFEEFSEEEDLKWRKKHRENQREYKQRSKTDKPRDEISDKELWQRLEELELQEELEQEMENMDKVPKKILKQMFSKISDPNPAAEDIHKAKKEENNKTSIQHDNRDVKEGDNKNHHTHTISSDNNGTLNPKHTTNDVTVPNEILVPKDNLLREVKDKQNELKEKLAVLENKSKSPSQTVKDLLTKLDELEKLEELEDEMDRLDDVLEDEDIEESENKVVDEQPITPAVKIKRSVSFADEDDSKTLQLTFRHSKVKPDTTPYDEAKGITKPSDIYAALPNQFSETTSILKKSKYEREYTPSGPSLQKRTKVDDFQEAEDNRQLNKTIVINDVVEKIIEHDNKYDNKCNGKYDNIENEEKPMSLFKKRRQQNLR